jgi:hypothetical protein
MERGSPQWLAFMKDVGCSEEEAWALELRGKAARKAQKAQAEREAPRMDAMASMHVLKSVRDAAKARIAARAARQAGGQ